MIDDMMAATMGRDTIPDSLWDDLTMSDDELLASRKGPRLQQMQLHVKRLTSVGASLNYGIDQISYF